MQRLRSKHWADPSMKDASLWPDDEFQTLESEDIILETAASLKPIDDLAIVVLFSVFESHVRDYLAGARTFLLFSFSCHVANCILIINSSIEDLAINEK